MNIYPGSKVRMRLTWSSARLNHHHIYTVLCFTEDNKQIFLEGLTGGPFNVDAFEVVPQELLSNQVVFKGTGKPHPSKEEEWQAKWLQLAYPFMLVAGQTYTVKRRETIKREALVLEGYESCKFDADFFVDAIATNQALFNPTTVVRVAQQEVMLCDPVSGSEKPFPSQAAQYREWHGKIAWLYNPWTGEKRIHADVATDPFGYSIAAKVAQKVAEQPLQDLVAEKAKLDEKIKLWTSVYNEYSENMGLDGCEKFALALHLAATKKFKGALGERIAASNPTKDDGLDQAQNTK